MRSIITLTTDFGVSSPYVAQMKGVILSICRDADVVDISHAIAPQNIREGAIVLADVTPRVVKARTCLYTQVDGARFIIDAHPDDRRVMIVSPCSGHGFKHSAAIGEALAQWTLEGASRIDLGNFSLRA